MHAMQSYPVRAVRSTDGELLQELRHEPGETAEGPRESHLRVHLEQHVLLRVDVHSTHLARLVLQLRKGAASSRGPKSGRVMGHVTSRAGSLTSGESRIVSRAWWQMSGR